MLSRLRGLSPLTRALFAFGYPTSIMVITRFVPVVRHRRVRWFVAHQLAVAAIVTGWAIEGVVSSVIVNGAWLATATAWWMRGRRSGAR